MELPKTLYKYRTLGDGKGKLHEFTSHLITDGQVYFSDLKSLNDPHEARPVIVTKNSASFEERYEILADEMLKYVSSRVDLSKVSTEEMDAFLERAVVYISNMLDRRGRFNRKIIKRFANVFHVLSLTENPMNTLMWAYYGYSHRGVCVGIDASVFPISNARATQYVNEVPIIELKNLTSAELYINFKHTKWSHEAEWRVVSRKKGTVMLGKDSIREVIVGMSATKADVMALRRLLKDSGSPAILKRISDSAGNFNLRAVMLR